MNLPCSRKGGGSTDFSQIKALVCILLYCNSKANHPTLLCVYDFRKILYSPTHAKAIVFRTCDTYKTGGSGGSTRAGNDKGQSVINESTTPNHRNIAWRVRL